MTRYCDYSYTTALTEEIKSFLIYNDINDIEGFAFKDWNQYNTNELSVCTNLYASPALQTADARCWHAFKANGSPDSPEYRMGGRPVGFEVVMSDQEREGGMALWREWDLYDHSALYAVPWEPQPVAIRIIYNGCNCPASAFIGDRPVSDMTI
jgi:hypothetical protein